MILVTGGAGFIGGHLVRRLVGEGADVRVFDLQKECVDGLCSKQVDFVAGDIRDRAAVDAAVRGCRQVYHLAGNPNLWTRNRDDFEAVNHQGTVNVLHAALDAGAERVLHTSTESILGRKEEVVEAVEGRDLRESDMVGPYCLSKYRGETEAFRLAASGAPVIVAAPTLPVGPGDRRRTPPTRMTVSFCRGELPAYLDCRFNMIDARDVSEGMIAAMEKGVAGKRYLLGFRNIRLIEWLEIVGRVVGRKPPKLRVPYWVALASAWASEWVADRFTGEIPNATLTGVRLTRNFMHFDPTPTLTALGLHPRPIEESARDAVAWYREMKWI